MVGLIFAYVLLLHAFANSLKTNNLCSNYTYSSNDISIECCDPANVDFCDACKCQMEIGRLDCSTQDCKFSKLPPDASIVVVVKHWTLSSFSAVSNTICGRKIESLTLRELGAQFSKLNLRTCIPNLQKLAFDLEVETEFEIEPMFRSLSHLRSLLAINVDFEFSHSLAPWLLSLEELHIENSSMAQLPKALIKNKILRTVFIKGTELFSASALSHLDSLVSAQLSHNQINDLHSIVLFTPKLRHLDLSYNQIRTLSGHIFSRSIDLRIVDLSNNPISSLPNKIFNNNRRLKFLKLDHTLISVIPAGAFSGLTALRTLSFSQSPLFDVHPLAFVSLRGLKTLDLKGGNLTRVPAAVTHLCHLTHLTLDANLLFNAASFPPEVMVHLSSLSHLGLSANPLQEFPPSLLLLSTANTKLLRGIVQSLSFLPAWRLDRCTPYYFSLHFINSSYSLRQLVEQYTNSRMNQEGLSYCRERYEWMTVSQEIFLELEKTSGCSISRNLKRASAETTTLKNNASIVPEKESTPVLRPATPCLMHRKATELAGLLIASVSLNIVCFLIIAFFLCFMCAGGRKLHYESY